MLTGKNLENFIEWLHQHMVTQAKGVPFRFIEQFNNLPLSMQFGILQDYADSIGCRINVEYFEKKDCYMFDIWNGKEYKYDNIYHETRDEARKAAIKEFDDIVNKN